jgi:hypothetical protein
MFIDQETLKRVNINGPYKGRSKLDTLQVRAEVGVVEIPDPIRESDETHYNQEVVDPPYLISTPKSAEQLADLRWTKLKQIRDDLTENGGCFIADKWFHTDVKSKQQQMALAMLGANIPAGLQWKTMDGSFIEMTATLARQLFAAQVAREQSLFTIAETKKLDSSDINDGWGARYDATPV